MSAAEVAGPASGELERLLPEGRVELPRVRSVAGGPVYRFCKRAFDIVASAAALVILAVPMAIVAVAVRAGSSGPAIYVQERVGAGGRTFRLYKFRSMYTDAESRGAQWAGDSDPRVTPLGAILRRTRLDEVPQFWNVLRGDMSLVGPRPERPVFHDEFCKRIGGWEQRTLVRPGITGLAQVEGGYDLLPAEKAQLDISYIEGRSLCLDLSIMLRTLGVLRSGEGAR